MSTCKLLYYGHAAVSHCLCSCTFFCFVPVKPGTASDNHLSADGKRYQFLQPDGSTVLHYHGLSDGFWWYF